MAGFTENSSDGDSEAISNINITPFVDVVLVLLVIFMVTAPMMMKDVIKVKLPKAASGDGAPSKPLSFVVMRNGNILIDGALASEGDIQTTVRAAVAADPETQAIIAADQDSLHKDVVRVIDLVKTAGLSRFAIQIEKQNP